MTKALPHTMAEAGAEEDDDEEDDDEAEAGWPAAGEWTLCRAAAGNGSCCIEFIC